MAGPLTKTHAVAAVVFLMRGDYFLVLKRATEPRVWAPPSGRLESDEDPRASARREVMEETGLEAEELHVLDYWFGKYREGYLLSLEFIAEAKDWNVKLSEEHTDFRWATIQDLREGNPPLTPGRSSFPLEAFERAWARVCEIRERMKRI